MSNESHHGGDESPAQFPAEPVRRFPIPPGRDPFINTCLIPVGKCSEGKERFWISSWNHNSGCIGVLVSETGEYRLFRFEPPHSGFYSAVAQDADTLWLCGNLSRLVRLTLSTGEIRTFPTGVSPAVVFQGMILDPATGKLFVAAYDKSQTWGISFDTRSEKVAKIYDNVSASLYMRSSFENGDGTFTIVLHNPVVTLLQWNPRSETVQSQTLAKLSHVDESSSVARLITNEAKKAYFPYRGWYDSMSGEFETDPKPVQEATWFARKKQMAWGIRWDGRNGIVHLWDMQTGCVNPITSIPDVALRNINLTDDEKIVAISIYGDFYRFDGRTGVLEISKRLPATSIGPVDCVYRIDENRLLGTSFISQRFWELDLKTGEGFNCGRAAPGGGQVMNVWEVDGMLFWAAYAGGELMQYDPKKHPCFPENPRVVADPPIGMRPVAFAKQERSIFYSCSLEYGKLGCVLTQYDTGSAASFYRHKPLGDQMVISMFLEPEEEMLLVGTSIFADQGSCKPTAAHPCIARISASDFSCKELVEAPDDIVVLHIIGLLNREEYLATATYSEQNKYPKKWFRFSRKNLCIPSLEGMNFLPGDTGIIRWIGEDGLFILQRQDSVELWDMNAGSLMKVLHRNEGDYVRAWHIQNESLYIATPREILVLENCLTGYR